MQYSLFFLTCVLKTAPIRLLVGHVNSRRCSRKGVINARCSVRGSLWASWGVCAPPCTSLPFATAATVMFVCHLARRQQGRGGSSLLGARPRRSYGVPSTSDWIELRRLQSCSWSAKDEGKCLFTPGRQQIQNLAAFKQTANVFFFLHFRWITRH